MQNILLTDLIELQVLQKIQDGFSKFTGMAALTTDADGKPITEGSGFTDFCMNLTRSTGLGRERCAECDKMGAVMTLENGRPAVYGCHAGLLDFAAPIMLEDKMIGSFIGGQICSSPLNEETVRDYALQIGVDADAYAEAAAKIHVVEFETVERSAEFLSQIAEILSQMAYKSYNALQQSQMMEKVTRSHNAYIVDMNDRMKQHVTEWIEEANKVWKENKKTKAGEAIRRLIVQGNEFLNTIDDTVEYSKLTTGEIELDEVEYSIHDLVNSVVENLREQAKQKETEITVEFDEKVPPKLLGASSYISQIVTRLVRYSIQYTERGSIRIWVGWERRSYATHVHIRIEDTGKGLTQDEIEAMQGIFQEENDRNENLGISMVPVLLKQMSGLIRVKSELGQGCTCEVMIPQLNISDTEAS